MAMFLFLDAAGAASDREIELGAELAGYPGLVGTQAKLLDGDGVEPSHHLLAELLPERSHHPDPELGTGVLRDRVLAALQRLHHAHDLAHGDPPALAREPIAAARTAHAREDAGAHQLLQHGLEIATRNALATRDLGRLLGQRARVIGDVQHRFDRKQELLAEPQHGDQRPVEPKPPAPRRLSGNVATAVQAMRETGASTSCATRSPRARVTGSVPRFARITRISPR